MNENTIIYAACLLGCGLQFVLSGAITWLARKRFRRAAYFIGFLILPLIPIALWFIYVAIAHREPCPPEGQIGCGEADAYALIILAGLFLLNILGGALLQFILWMIWRKRAEPNKITQ